MHQYPTRVKAAGLNSVEEAKQLAGVESVTLAPPLVNELLAIPVVEEGSLEQASLFGPSALSSSNGHEAPEDKKTVNGNYKDATGLGKLSFIDDESKFRDAFAKREAGKGEWKTQQVRNLSPCRPVVLTETQLAPRTWHPLRFESRLSGC